MNNKWNMNWKWNMFLCFSIKYRESGFNATSQSTGCPILHEKEFRFCDQLWFYLYNKPLNLLREPMATLGFTYAEKIGFFSLNFFFFQNSYLFISWVTPDALASNTCIFATQCRWPWIFQTINSVRSNNQV